MADGPDGDVAVRDLVFDEFAWAVGLFEGEGCIDTVSSPHGKRRPYPRARLTTTDVDVARRFAALGFGGRVGGPYAKPNGNKDQYVWEITGHAAIQFLHRVMPYLCERRLSKAREVLALAGVLHEDQEVFAI